MLGLISILFYSHSVTTSIWTIGKNEEFQLPIFYGQPIFLMWLLVHFIVSVRHYVGILSKNFWRDLLDKSEMETRP
jgi:hypothetical protein